MTDINNMKATNEEMKLSIETFLEAFNDSKMSASLQNKQLELENQRNLEALQSLNRQIEEQEMLDEEEEDMEKINKYEKNQEKIARELRENLQKTKRKNRAKSGLFTK